MLFGPGGGATHLLYLCAALVKQGAEVTLLSRCAHRTTPVVKHHRDIPIRFVTTPFNENRNLYRLSTTWALFIWPFLLGRKSYDVLYTWEVSRFTQFLSRFVRPGGLILLQRIGEPMSAQSLPDPMMDIIDGLLVETPFQADAARQVLKQNTSIHALPLMGHCVSASARNGHLPSETFQIAFLGRYHPDKGIYRLLEIWPQLGIGRAQLHFYAWGEEREELKRRIIDLGLQDHVHVRDGYTTAEELSTIMGQTDLVVLPSETEGLPVVLLEAMAHGVPFVATDVGAVRSLAVNNPDVRVVALNNQAFKEGIEEMVQAIRRGLVRSDRLQAYYQERYGYENLSRQWTNALLSPEQVWI